MSGGNTGGMQSGGRSAPLSTNPVDADKLWRDRINQELLQQRTWHEEYGFMVAESTSANSAANAKSAGTLSAQTANLGAKDLEELRVQLSKSTMRSTAQASFTKRPTPELYNDGAHNRRKFRDT